MKNKDKTSTEYDITIENKKLNDLLNTREDVYDIFTEYEYETSDRLKNCEVKVQTEPSVRKGGNFFIEHSMKKPLWETFRPSGISTTKADTFALPVLTKNGSLHPILIVVPTQWLKDKIEQGKNEGWVGDVTTYPLKATKDVNKGYVINILKLLEE